MRFFKPFFILLLCVICQPVLGGISPDNIFGTGVGNNTKHFVDPVTGKEYGYVYFKDCGTEVINVPSNQVNAAFLKPTPPANCNPGTCGVTSGQPINCAISPGGATSQLQACNNFPTNWADATSLGNVSQPQVVGGPNQKNKFSDVTLNNSANLTFLPNNIGNTPTTYFIQNLQVKNNSTLTLPPGDYWIQDFFPDNNGTHSIVVLPPTTPGGSPTARLFILNYHSAGILEQVLWNYPSSSYYDAQKLINPNYKPETDPLFNPNKLFMYFFSDFNITNIQSNDNKDYQGRSYVNGYLYTQKEADFGGVRINGGVSARSITFENISNNKATFSGEVNNTSTALAGLDLGPNFACLPGGNHFVLTYSNVGVRCQLFPLTVSVTREDGTTDTNYQGTIKLQVSDTSNNPITSNSGTWTKTSGQGSFSAGNGNGQATYAFVAADKGTATFYLNYQTGAANVIDIVVSSVDDPNILGAAVAGPITFSSVSYNILTPQSLIAGTTTPITIQAISPATSCGVLTSYAGDKTVKFWTQYINPISGTVASTINGTTGAACLASSDPSYNTCSTNASSQVINFTQGIATINLKYKDVGTLRLNALDTANGGPSGESPNFIVTPSRLVVSSAPGTCDTNTINSLIGSAPFKKAGEAFSATVEVRDSEGTVTPNFGNELSGESIKLLAATLKAPTTGRNGSSNNGNISSNATVVKTSPGVYQVSNLSYDEVGIITLKASTVSGSYQTVALTDPQKPESGCVGRFVPDHFDIAQKTAPQFATGCNSGGFSYLGQPIPYQTAPVATVTAKSLSGSVTKNYTGQFWRLDPTASLGSITQAYTAGTYPATSAAIPTLSITAANTSFTAGADTGTGARDYTLSFVSGSGIVFPKINQLVPAFIGEVSLTLTVKDADNITNTPFSFGNTTLGGGINFAGNAKTFYQGRVKLVNAFGSELLPLIVPITVEYYDGVSRNFLTNTLDSCTVMTDPTKLILSIVPGQSAGTLTTTPTLSGFVAGVDNLTLTAPGKGHNGYVDIQPDLSPAGFNLPWLQYDWPQSGAPTNQYKDNPFGRGTFGIYKGSGKIIYRQEVVQ